MFTLKHSAELVGVHGRSSNRGSAVNGNHLPVEIWVIVLRDAQYDDLLPRYKWLRRYALVCRAWRPHAQQLLFAHVALRGSVHCKLFTKAMLSFRDPEHSDWLRRSVKVLSMLMDHQEIYSDVLQLCPNLQELHLCVYHTFFRPNVLAALASYIPSTIRILRVRAYHYTALFQLLSLFPHIEYLEVDYRGPNSPIPTPIPWTPPEWCLRQLWYSNRRQAGYRFIEWALSGQASSSRSTLEVLHAQCPTFSPSSLSTLGVTNLRSLSIPRLLAQDDLSMLSGLEEVWLTVPRHPSVTFLPLPTRVRHLVLYRLSENADYGDIFSELTAHFERPGCRLEAITYHRECKREEPGHVEDIRMLHDFCAGHNVHFELMDPPYGFYAGERVPFKPVSEFPQPLLLSSRRVATQARLASILRPTPRKSTLTGRITETARKAFGHPVQSRPTH